MKSPGRGASSTTFIAVDSVSIVFIEVKKVIALGESSLDSKGQVLAVCACMFIYPRFTLYFKPAYVVVA